MELLPKLPLVDVKFYPAFQSLKCLSPIDTNSYSFNHSHYKIIAVSPFSQAIKLFWSVSYRTIWWLSSIQAPTSRFPEGEKAKVHTPLIAPPLS